MNADEIDEALAAASARAGEKAHTPHRIDIEAAWEDFTRMRALVDESDADEFLGVLYAWRDECVTDALRTSPAQTSSGGDA